MQIIFQDSVGSLNPRMRVRDIVGEGLAVHGVPRKRAAPTASSTRSSASGSGRRRCAATRTSSAAASASASGSPARSSCGRSSIVADEPVSALDVSIQSQVLNLLVELKQEFGLTYLFVAHDLAVVGYISDRVAVMYLGKVVELADAADLFARPLHPYTVALLSAIPTTEPGAQAHADHAAAATCRARSNPPSGCRFRTRCPIAQPICAEVEPPLADHGERPPRRLPFRRDADPREPPLTHA